MRVLLDTTYADRAPFSGTGVYLERISEELGRLPDVEVVSVSNPARRPPGGGGLGSVSNAVADARWASVDLPRRAREAGADLIHHPLPAIAWRPRPAQVVTVHDLAFERLPEAFDPRFRIYAHWAHRAAARRAGAVICVSETTAADVRSLWEVPEERIVVAKHGPGQRLPSLARAEPPEHFLYVGDAEPRKNLGTLLAAYAAYRGLVSEPLELVIAGGADAGGDGVRVERKVSRERLAELHAGAAALVHTSLYEGFGLTVLEAMTTGAPVIAADAPGAREVCGDGAAVYTDPHDPKALADAMVAVAGDPALRARLSASGLARAAEFSWTASARAHVEAYSLALRA
jgi:alpha-1,3-rhamnosyl/mannosyltransferase